GRDGSCERRSECRAATYSVRKARIEAAHCIPGATADKRRKRNSKVEERRGAISRRAMPATAAAPRPAMLLTERGKTDDKRCSAASRRIETLDKSRSRPAHRAAVR